MPIYVYLTQKKDEPVKSYVGITTKPIESGYLGSGIAIHNAIKKYGKDAFQRIDVMIFSDDKRKEAHLWEYILIQNWQTETKYGGYNISPTGGMDAGFNKCSEETKKKMSEIKKIQCNTLEFKKRLSDANKGKSLSDKTKKRISEAFSGEKNPMYGKHRSDEVKKKISESELGEKHHFFGKHLSMEHRKKLSEAHKGIHFSEEHKKKLSEAIKKVWKRRKEKMKETDFS